MSDPDPSLVTPAPPREAQQACSLRSLAEYLGWGHKSDEDTWQFVVEREQLLRVAQDLLETHKSNAATAELAIRERIAALHASEAGPRPQLAWSGPDEDGDLVVELTGFPHIAFCAHGETAEEALHLLADQILGVFGCDDCKAHASEAGPQDNLATKMQSLIEDLACGSFSERYGLDADTCEAVAGKLAAIVEMDRLHASEAGVSARVPEENKPSVQVINHSEEQKK